MLKPRTAFLALPLVVLGCELTNEPDDLPDWQDGYPDTGMVAPPPTSPELEGIVTIAPVLNFQGRFGLAEDQTQPCTYDTKAGFSEVRCQLDANELDLYFHGWGYDVLVEAGTCTYLGVHNYMYQAWNVGTGPDTVRIEYGPNGEIVNEVNAVNGVPSCEFDHSLRNPDYPNCCYGTYTYEVVLDGFAATPQTRFWAGGPVGQCYDGAAYYSNITQFLDNGVPARIIFDVNEATNSTTSVTFAGPIDNLEATNIPVANYVDPLDPTPVGFGGTWSVPLYEIECLDDAEEVQVRFLIEVRDWDTVEQFDLEGDPDIGVRAGPGEPSPLEPNGSGSPLNDRWDWRDFTVEAIDWVEFRD